MRCGTKCFYVQLERDDKSIVTSVIARKPQEARKIVRKKYGSDANIITVRSKRKI